KWEDMVYRMKNLKKHVKIALVGKYVELHDAYISVVEALSHGGLANDADVEIKWVNAIHLNSENLEEKLSDVDGILVPGGFGTRGIEGKILAVNYARTKDIPFLGICLGMQMAVVEFARNVLGMEDANSSEINPGTTNPVIDLMPEQKDIDELGGTMRLGLYPAQLKENTFAREAYGKELIYERHRHRYEFNNSYMNDFIEKGMVFSGINPNKQLVEIVEIPANKWFVGTQFHPELKSRPNNPHPIFVGFIKASLYE
ncbi:MAG TPA: CTP synthase, partial [Clostridiaceae bacterium]